MCVSRRDVYLGFMGRNDPTGSRATAVDRKHKVTVINHRFLTLLPIRCLQPLLLFRDLVIKSYSGLIISLLCILVFYEQLVQCSMK